MFYYLYSLFLFKSHLREQVLPEEIPTPIPQDFAYESFIVTDPPHLKIKPKPKPIKFNFSLIFLEILFSIFFSQEKHIQPIYPSIRIDISKV